MVGEGAQCSRAFSRAFNQFYLYAKPRETGRGGQKKKRKNKTHTKKKKKKTKLLLMLKLSIY